MIKKPQLPRVLFLIQLPPPLHGVSLLNKQVFESDLLNQIMDKSLVEIRFADKIPELQKKTLKKLIKFVLLCLKLISHLITFKPGYVYFSIMPVGVGFYRDIILAGLIKLYGAHPIYHLHNQGICNEVQNSKIKCLLYQFVFSNSAIIHLGNTLIDRELTPLKLRNSLNLAVPIGIPIMNLRINKHNKKKKIIRLLFISHINFNKGLETLLDSLSIIKNHNSGIKFKLSVLGAFYSNRYKKSIFRKVNSLDLIHMILFTDEVNLQEKKQYLEQADIFVFPSLNDASGLVVLEAMQAGLACIVTDVGVWPEYFTNNQEVRIIPPANPEILAKEIIELTLNSKLRNTLGKKAQAIAQNFSIKKFESDMVQCFKMIFSSKRSD